MSSKFLHSVRMCEKPCQNRIFTLVNQNM
ncbi:unnamed protein product [Larinioides sclopetarius]|uniref:Uncharacterized protein n=1 Tax=Larinioides sclopetarius TaxID=280406 RepID=A0AAV2ASK8_9ARAC